MAKLKATPKNYTEAKAILAGRSSLRLGNNTYLEQHFTGIVVRLHSTNIVVFQESGTRLYSGGYRTVTTKDRINQCIEGVVFQRDFEWFYVPSGPNGYPNWDTTPIPFEEGMSV